jgi:hypothetical protein
MLLVPRSLATSVRPSGLKEIWAPSAPSSLSGRFESVSGSSFPAVISNPSMLAEALLRT